MSELHGHSRAFQDRDLNGDANSIAGGGGNASQVGVFLSPRTGSEQLVRNIIRARADRSAFLPSHLFADPAWDMLIDLYLADIQSKRICVTSLCSASNVPATTALRWIVKLHDEGLVERAFDPNDHRRVFVSLSAKGFAAMDGFFSSAIVRSIHDQSSLLKRQ